LKREPPANRHRKAHSLSGRSRAGFGYPCAMNEPVIPVLAFLKTLIPGAAGAAVSLWFKPASLSPLSLLWYLLCGGCVAHYIGGAIVEWRALDGLIADAVKFVTGVHGLGLLVVINAQLPSFVASIRKRFVGDSQ